VIHDETRIYGDGINIAARLEAIAQPGGICVSPRFGTKSKASSPSRFVDMGPQALKNIAKPCRCMR
jgi:class 3 adenylate cyclase